MKDAVFGDIEWDETTGAWQTLSQIPRPLGLGANLPGQTDDATSDPMARHGTIGLSVGTVGGVRTAPTEVQRRVWKAFVQQFDAKWATVVHMAFQEYLIQRPVSLRWWKAVYGEWELERALPTVTRAEDFVGLIHPYAIAVHPEGEEIGIALACSWNPTDGFGALLKPDRIEVGRLGSTFVQARSAFESIDDPVFGLLRRILPTDAAWIGTTPCTPYDDFYAVAAARASFRSDPEGHGIPSVDLPWERLHGHFRLRVTASPGHRPDSEQAQALIRLREDPVAAIQIVEDIYRFYQQKREERRSNGQSHRMPDIQGSGALKELLQLSEVCVHQGGFRAPALGLTFRTTWPVIGMSNSAPAWVEDSQCCLGVLWRDGKVAAIGDELAANLP